MTPLEMIAEWRDRLLTLFVPIEYLGHGKGKCFDCKATFGTTVERTCTCHAANDNPEGDERHRAALKRHDELVRSFIPNDDPRFFEMEYTVPCGKTTGHGESCAVGWLCAACTEVQRLRAELASARQAEHLPLGSRFICEDTQQTFRFVKEVSGATIGIKRYIKPEGPAPADPRWK